MRVSKTQSKIRKTARKNSCTDQKTFPTRYLEVSHYRTGFYANFNALRIEYFNKSPTNIGHMQLIRAIFREALPCPTEILAVAPGGVAAATTARPSNDSPESRKAIL